MFIDYMNRMIRMNRMASFAHAAYIASPLSRHMTHIRDNFKY